MYDPVQFEELITDVEGKPQNGTYGIVKIFIMKAFM